MNLDLADIGAMLVVFTPLALLLLRIFVIREGASLEDLIVPRADFEWPRGVQEEEPVRWQVERLTPSDQRLRERTEGSQPAHAASGLRSAVRREPSLGGRGSTTAS